MDERNVDEPVIGGAPNLDDMLGNLQVYNQSHNKIIRIKKKIMEEHGRTWNFVILGGHGQTRSKNKTERHLLCLQVNLFYTQIIIKLIHILVNHLNKQTFPANQSSGKWSPPLATRGTQSTSVAPIATWNWAHRTSLRGTASLIASRTITVSSVQGWVLQISLHSTFCNNLLLPL